MLVKVKEGYREYYKYNKFIFKVIQFTKSGTTNCAVLIPFKNYKWEEVDYSRKDNWNELCPRGIYSIDIDDLEIIPDCEVPENIKRDIKLSKLLD